MNSQNMKGYIYCVSNASFKANIYKVGYTTMDLETRIKSLYKTGVPTKFNIHFAKMVNHCYQKEQEIHGILDDKKLRLNPSREFFHCKLSTIKNIFDKVDGVWWNNSEAKVTPIQVIPVQDTPIQVTTNTVTKRKKIARKAKQCRNYKY